MDNRDKPRSNCEIEWDHYEELQDGKAKRLVEPVTRASCLKLLRHGYERWPTGIRVAALRKTA